MAGTMTTRRSVGKMQIGRAVWYAKPGVVELRSAPLPAPRPGEARVRTLWSGISRGTERLVSRGLVPRSEWERMRAPLQDGAFPFPVKYGYCATGIVEDGPDDLVGRAVFCLAPHQDHFVAPIAMLAPIPDGIPARRATLAANMETALNAHWDAATGPGDSIVVVGAGIVGLLVAVVAARIPGARVVVTDVDPGRAALCASLGLAFSATGALADTADVVFHTSASAAGLATAIGCAGMEASVVELSWYGDADVAIPLGGPFHSRRIRLIASQVGQVAASRRPRWSYRRRLETALSLLADPALDALVDAEIAFDDTPRLLPAVLAPGAPGLAPVIRYPGA
jgi:threonine dehydrogenase-like Zn-dependent dehydrogenase